MADSGDGTVCTFFRKLTGSKNIRKRRAAGSDDDSPSATDEDSAAASGSSAIPLAKRPSAGKGLRFSSAQSGSSSNTADAHGGGSRLFQFESSNAVQVAHDSRATAALETETEFDRDARAIRERELRLAAESLARGPKSAAEDAKLYKGMHAYTDYKAGFRREQTVAAEKAGGAHGPLRASANIRMSMRFDYQPDICKDYKETGYCGYGDSCKFMHDRGDYKSGWQIEREWEEAEKERKRRIVMRSGDGDEDGSGGGGEADADDDEEELPFACFICRQPFEDPVVTRCKHYFCEHCALKHHAKNKKCFVCNKPTLGLFNTAQEIRRRMAQEKVKEK